MRPFISGTIAALVITASMFLPAQAEDTATPPKAEPVDVSTTNVPAVTDAVAEAAERADDDAADLVAQLPARRTDDFGLVGVTWTRGFDDTDMTVQVRLRTDGAWADWEELEVESDEGEGGRDGTEPLWVGSADGVAVRVTSPTGERPSGLAVATIDPGSTPSTSTTASPAFYEGGADSAVTQVADGAPAYTPEAGDHLAIVVGREEEHLLRLAAHRQRDAWCRRPPHRGLQLVLRVAVGRHRPCHAGVSHEGARLVRHRLQLPGRQVRPDLRGPQRRRRPGRPWRPRRRQDASTPTRWACPMMGTFTSSAPSAATKDAMVKLIGWRLGTTFHPATGKYKVGSYSLNRIAGHRNVVGTACPGDAAYAWLSASGGLRDRVEELHRQLLVRDQDPRGAAGRCGDRTGLHRRVPVHARPAAAARPGSSASTCTRRRTARSRSAAPTARATRRGASSPGCWASRRPTRRSRPSARSRCSGSPRARSTASSWGARSRRVLLYSKIEDTYLDLGEATSELGAPTTSMVRISDGRYRAYFQHGHMTMNASGTVGVYLH